MWRLKYVPNREHYIIPEAIITSEHGEKQLSKEKANFQSEEIIADIKPT